MVEALHLLFSSHNNATLRDLGPYQYNIIDITRQAIVNLFTDVHVTLDLLIKNIKCTRKTVA